MLAATKEIALDAYLSPLNIIRGSQLALSYRLVNDVLAYIHVDLSSHRRETRRCIGKWLELKYGNYSNIYYHCLWDTDRFGYSIGYRSNPRNVTPLLNSLAINLEGWDPLLAQDVKYLSLKYHIVSKWLGVFPLVDIIFSYGWGLTAKAL